MYKKIIGGLALSLLLSNCSTSPDDERALSLYQHLCSATTFVNANISQTLDEMKEDTDERPTLRPLTEAGKSALQKIEPLLDFIRQLKYELIESSGGIWAMEEEVGHYKDEYYFTNVKVTTDATLNGKPRYAGNQSVPIKILIHEGLAEKLQMLVRETRAALLQVVDDIVELSESTDSEGRRSMRGVKFDPKDIEKLKADLVLKPLDSTLFAGLFPGISVAEALALLAKYEIEAKDATSQVVNYLRGNIGCKCLCYDKFDVFSSSPKPYIILGETFFSEIALGSFSSQAEFTVSVDGKALRVEDGKASYQVRPGSVGTQSYMAEIRVIHPLTQKIEIIKKEFQFEVGMPSLSIAADQMNVFYMGMDNPIKINATAAKPEDILISGTNGLLIQNLGGGKYNVKATKTTTAGEFGEIIATHRVSGKKIANFSFRVKNIPAPRAFLSSYKSGGEVVVGEIKAQRELMAVSDEEDINVKCQVNSYTLYYKAPNQPIQKITQKSGAFQGKALDAIQAATPGSVYQFQDIYATCRGDDKARLLNSLAFTVR